MIRIDRNVRLLITGAGGVLGKAVIAHLQDEGFTQLLTPNKLELDLLDPISTQAYFRDNQPKAIIHLAATVFGLAGNLKFQMRSALENTAINNNLFTQLQHFPIERLFFAGTVASYPFPYKGMPLVESMFFDGLPHYGEFGYAMAKRHAYTYLRLLTEELGVHCTYGIFTNLYGPHDRFDVEHGHVIPSLIVKAYESVTTNQPFNVWGDGLAERDFLHAKDAARAVLFCLDHNKDNSLVNISSGQGVSIRHIAETIASAAGISDVCFEPEKPVGIPVRVVDNSELVSLGFVPSISIEEGLSSTFEWYVSNIESIRK